MSDCEEDSGVHSQTQDERMDLVADNEGIDAILYQNSVILLFIVRAICAL